MTEQEKLQSKFKDRSWIKPDPGAHRRNAEGLAPRSEHVGLEQGNGFVRRLKLFLRGGSIFSIPYAHLPVIIYDPDRDLKIRTREVEVTITGRGLDKLHHWLNEETVLWIKESASGADTEEMDVFVSGISIEGELTV